MQQPTWVKATASFANGNCVEVATLPDGMIGIRDSKNPDGPVLRFTPGEWDAFVVSALAGEFDRAWTDYFDSYKSYERGKSSPSFMARRERRRSARC